jgi:hypothetical protein
MILLYCALLLLSCTVERPRLLGVKFENVSNKKFKPLPVKRVNPVSCFKPRQEQESN